MKPIVNECQFKFQYAKHFQNLKNRRRLLKTSTAAVTAAAATETATKNQQQIIHYGDCY